MKFNPQIQKYWRKKNNFSLASPIGIYFGRKIYRSTWSSMEKDLGLDNSNVRFLLFWYIV